MTVPIGCKNIQKARLEAEIPRNVAASALGKTVDAYNNIEYGRTPLKIQQAVILADLFGVSVDYLIGRSEEVLPACKRKEHFRSLYETCYELFLTKTLSGAAISTTRTPSKAFDTAYPYNLLDWIYRKETGNIWKPLTLDQHMGLNYALSRLTEKEQIIIREYFRGRKTMEKVGEGLGITRERIRQIIEKAVRKLRHPTSIRFIEEGYAGATISQERLSIKEQRRMLQEERKLLNKEKVQTEQERKAHRAQAEKEEQEERQMGAVPHPLKEFSLLSTRAQNALERNRIDTVGDLLTRIKDTRICRFKNVGITTIEELLEYASKVSGKNQRDILVDALADKRSRITKETTILRRLESTKTKEEKENHYGPL